MTRPIFVFGSNLAGRHGKGVAKWAMENRGAVYGRGKGMQGDSYAIPTKDQNLRPLPLYEIESHVRNFIDFAQLYRNQLLFEVTPVGCGLAGYDRRQIGVFFNDAPKNVLFTKDWVI